MTHAIFRTFGTALAFYLGFQSAEAKVTLDAPVVMTQVPGAVKGPPSGWDANGLSRSDWFEGGRVVVVAQDGATRVLSEGFQSACDPSLSFDATRVLFAGKKATGTCWRIWEIGIDGQNLRAVSPENQEARNPIYATTLFTLDSPAPWFTLIYVALEPSPDGGKNIAGSSLYSVKLDGTEQRRLTYHPYRVLDPFQMWDGRILYAAERYPVEPGAPAGKMGLYSVHIVGTEMLFYGGEQGRRIQHMACATEQRSIVFVESDEVTWDGAGQLACLKEQRPHHSYRRLTTDPAWQYLYPSPWQGNQLLVSRRPTDQSAPIAVCCFDAETGVCETLFAHPGYHNVQAQVALPRPQPDGHSTVVDPAKYTTGVFYAMNCYETDGRMNPFLTNGTLKRVRVIEGISRPSSTGSANSANNASALGESLATYSARRLLGEAPIETDGSFHIEVPADTPLLIQTLDDRGLALGSCGWVWVKPRENRGCVGCHEDPELTPENKFVLSLRRPAHKLIPPPEQRRKADFLTVVAPVLKNRCASVGCHGMPDSPLYLPIMADKPALQDMQQAYNSLRSAVEGLPSGGTVWCMRRGR